jgi:hypothetical protein
MARTVQTIDDLKALISSKGGVARSNVFAVALPPIAGLRSRELNLLCSSVNLPGRQIMTQERDIGLITQKVANNHVFDDVSLTFRCLNDYGIKEYFEAWQDRCIDQNSLEVGYLNDYAFNVKIHQLARGFGAPTYQTPFGLPKLPPMANTVIDMFLGGTPLGGTINALKGEIDLGFIGQNDTVYSCELIQAFPTSMGQIQLADANMGGVVELSVQLSYKNWRSSKQKGKPFGLNQSQLVGAVGNFIGGAIRPKLDFGGDIGSGGNFNFKQNRPQ